MIMIHNMMCVSINTASKDKMQKGNNHIINYVLTMIFDTDRILLDNPPSFLLGLGMPFTLRSPLPSPADEIKKLGTSIAFAFSATVDAVRERATPCKERLKISLLDALLLSLLLFCTLPSLLEN